MRFAVIVSRYNNKWVFVKHKDRDTFEIPGGHREENEQIIETARRELYEETGAVEFDIKQISIYSVVSNEETFGMLYYADIKKLNNLPESEIEKVELFDDIPDNLTYPYIQPALFEKISFN